MRERRPRRTDGPWDKEVLVHLAGPGLRPRDAAFDCLERLRTALRERDAAPGAVVKLSFFVRATTGAELARRQRDIADAVASVLPAARPAVGVVAQAPEGGRAVALEASVLRRLSRRIAVIPRSWRSFPYVVIEGPGGREVVSGGVGGGRRGDLAVRTASAFAASAAILKREGLGFADVMRQWNFVEDITGRSGPGPLRCQNYQIFNDIRAEAYARAGLRAGFPAATGIGAAAGGFSLELVAAAGAAAQWSVPISNPRQTDAHRYSSRVLVGAGGPDRSPRRTPKFERARVVVAASSATCYVSGTAAIVGETVSGRGDVEAQTRTTVVNIARLIAPANLRRAGVAAVGLAPSFRVVRTYVKRAADIPAVARIVRAAFPGAPALFVEADVCREDLLVEIEGAVGVVME